MRRSREGEEGKKKRGRLLGAQVACMSLHPKYKWLMRPLYI